MDHSFASHKSIYLIYLIVDVSRPEVPRKSSLVPGKGELLAGKDDAIDVSELPLCSSLSRYGEKMVVVVFDKFRH